MGQGIITVMLMVWLLTGCSATTSKEHSNAAFKKYSLACVARGISEHSAEHTDCVFRKVEESVEGRKRVENKMRKLFSKDIKTSVQADK